VRLCLHELLFDLWYRTDTSIDPAHEPVNPLIFAEVMRHAPFAVDAAVFLDYGAGKGRALILAARHGFAKAVGVELSPDLCALARTNIAKYPGVLQVTCAEAAAFEVPTDVTVAFLFNPFGAATMTAVLDRIGESLVRAPRDFHVVYLYPRLAGLFLGAGFAPVYRHGDYGVILHRPAQR
jgi:SAM-dependent methyltransferase